MTSPAFAAVTALTPDGPGRFAGVADARWTIAGKPNGGYLLAMIGRAAVAAATDEPVAAATDEPVAAATDEPVAAATEVRHPHVLAAGAQYLSPPEPGAVQLRTEVLRAGRSASQVRVSLGQDGRGCVEALVTVGRLGRDVTPYWDAGAPAMPAGRPDDPGAVRMTGISPAGLAVPIMDVVELRVDPATSRWTSGRPSGIGELRGWLSLPDGAAFDPLSLLYAVDAFPPATLDVELSGWVPTLELTAYVRALPAPGPVRVVQRAHLIDGGRADESCTVWDTTGRLVAQATQLAAIRLG